jgi:hypothetical protein
LVLRSVTAFVCPFLIFLAGCTSEVKDYAAVTSNPEFIHRSVKQVTDRIVHDIFSPPVASRIYAYTSVAGYEAMRHADENLVTLAGQLHGLDSVPAPLAGKVYCYELAAVKAILQVGRTLVFSEAEMDAFYANIMKEFRDSGIPDDVFERSIDYGQLVADHIIKWSSKDNYKQTRSFPKYTIVTDPATWKPTPPAYMDAVEPHWNKIRPFVIDSATQFRPEPAVTFSTNKSSEFFRQAVEVREMTMKMTDEQREIASFWDCNPFVMNVRGHVMFATKKISPGGHWMNITRLACRQSGFNGAEVCEAYVRVALSLADGFITCWDEKYRSNVVRPETFINQYLDENWVPLLQTPPFPEYTSGHSVISASAAEALTGIFNDNFAFTDSTEVEYGMTVRNFSSFYNASDEAAISRMYGGIHYRAACENGKVQGKLLGAFIRERIKTKKSAPNTVASF